MSKKTDTSDKRLSDEEKLMVMQCQRLIWTIAKEYRSRLHDLTLPELHQIGNLGVMEAVKHFDASKGYKLSTYAAWWIRSALRKNIATEGRTIQWPTHIYEKRAKLRVCRKESDLNRNEEQIANERGLTDKTIRNTRFALRTSMISLTKPFRIRNEEGVAVLEEIISDNGKYCPEHRFFKKEFRGILERFSNQEPEIYEVLKLFFGLDGDEKLSAKKISEKLKLNRYAVDKMKSEGLKRLREEYEKAF